jgi:hypothetical protein
MITLKTIKELIEKELNIEDISIETRENNLPNIRYIYCLLAKNNTKESLKSIGLEIKRDHATVLHGLNKIENILKRDEYLSSLYSKIKTSLKNYSLEKPSNFLAFKDIYELHNYYRINHITHTELYHKTISALLTRNENLKKNYQIFDKEIQQQIGELPLNEFKELQERIVLFLKVKKQLNKNRFQPVKRESEIIT